MKNIKMLLFSIFLLTVFVLATSNTVFGARPILKLASVSPSNNRAVVAIPEGAEEVSPGVFSLGVAIINGKRVEGFAFVDYNRGHAKPGTECGNDICEPSENANNCSADCGNGDTQSGSTCYSFLAKDTKWKSVEPYVVNASNNNGLNEAFVHNNFAGNVNKWETAANADIIGAGSSTNNALEADMNSPDNQNEVYFADIDSANAIGVTIVWGIFRGPPSQRELVEWDQVYDDADFDWSSSGEPNKMDFENIATHELGHSVGLGDLYEGNCTDETMYGYAANGETKKRTLEAGDIAGVSDLY